MALRGIRGATTADANEREVIVSATKELLQAVAAKNKLKIPEITSIIFTTTPDLNAEFPAVAARELGWEQTPLLCATEIAVPGSLGLCIRVLLHINSNKKQAAMEHVYLKAAVGLRR
ncbi:chorismate mutase [Candidatus Saganbacteria bacterium]|nr:chorismate mutase [Candidatus Saganbacteria bacterium]